MITAGQQLTEFVLELAQERDALRDALEDHLAVMHSTLGAYDSPRAALDALINWHVQVALDPAVGKKAEARLGGPCAHRLTPMGE